MIKFNPEGKEDLTYVDCLSPAMEIRDPNEAQQYLKDYADWIQSELDEKGSSESGMEIAKHNLGYFAGYYSNDVRKRVEKLFMCEHPLFGSIEKNGSPTAKEAFEIGLELSKKRKNETNTGY